MEYIKREAALESLCTGCEYVPIEEKEVCPYRFTGCQEYANIFSIPAADVVPVVRCKDCKWSDNYGLDLMCQKHSGITKNRFGDDIHFVEWHSKNFYCSDGERRTE